MGEIAKLFLRLGLFGFGGPVAVMAMMEEEAVRKRAWLTPAQFSEVYAVCKLLPGPVATQMAIYLGSLRAGSRWGGVVSGGVFILPAFLMVLGLSYLYANTGVVSRAGPVLLGLQAAALAVILLSTWTLGKGYRRDARAWAIAVSSAALVFARPGWEPLLILGFGLLGAYYARRRAGEISGSTLRSVAGLPLVAKLFWMCFKAGAFVFGTGLAVVPVLEADAVTRYGWLTHSQFMDGLAIGQVTPGPVVITSTFVGYLTAGFAGAAAATAGIFLPAFINVLFLVPRIWRRFSGTAAAAGFTSWAIPAVIGGILGTTLRLGAMTLAGPLAWGVFAGALIVALRKKPPAWILIPATGLVSGLLGRMA